MDLDAEITKAIEEYVNSQPAEDAEVEEADD